MAFRSRNVSGPGRSNRAAPAAAFEELEPRTLLSSGPGPLRLTVDFHTGVATITNTSSSPLTIDGYEIDSVGGHLNAATWYSIFDAATANPTPVVAALGSGATTFQEWGTAATALMEVSPTADVTFAPGASWTIGAPVNPDTASVADLTFQYSSVNVIMGGVVTPASAVTVTTVRTKDSTPALSGTVNNPAAVVQVTVNGHAYNATNHGDGTWALADNAITPALALGTYDVAVKALMGEQTVAQDSTADELTVVGPWNVSIVKTKDASETLGTTTKKGLFTVARIGGNMANPLTVSYTIDAGSTATAGLDYTALSGTVTILAGKPSATIDVSALDDGVAQPTQTVIVDLALTTDYDAVAGKAAATVSIADNSPVVS
ncbi:MAG: hypothetical protein NT031_11615, partial [Planctomycetota bacterium]|nr:hypothetical protein [Planctomycetota bacterium]